MSGGRIFISYDSEDQAAVNRIVGYLESRGALCWIASRDIPPRSIYAEAIATAMRDADACAVIVSAHANDSDAVKRELELASHYRKSFIPIRLDRTEPGPGLDYYLRNTQWIDYGREREQGLERIIAHLHAGAVAGTAPAPPPPLRKIMAGPALAVLACLLIFAGAGGYFASTHMRGVDAPGTATTAVPAPGTPPDIDAHDTPPLATAASSTAVDDASTTMPVGIVRRFPNGASSSRFCALISEFAQQALLGFDGWKTGAPLPQNGGATFWAASRTLPGTANCAISHVPGWSKESFVCFWNTESRDSALAQEGEFVQAIRSCPNVIRSFGGVPAIGHVELRVATLRTPQSNVLTLNIADSTNLAADAASHQTTSDRPKQN